MFISLCFTEAERETYPYFVAQMTCYQTPLYLPDIETLLSLQYHNIDLQHTFTSLVLRRIFSSEVVRLVKTHFKGSSMCFCNDIFPPERSPVSNFRGAALNQSAFFVVIIVHMSKCNIIRDFSLPE